MRRLNSEQLETLWRTTKEKAWEAPYCFMSPYYAHKEAAEVVGQVLPTEQRKQFLEFAHDQYATMSNYAGD